MNINYLLKDWAWRVNDGMPDPKNRNHLELLEATLRDHKYSEEFISAYITSIKEVGGHKYIKRTGTAPNYKYTYPEDGGTKGAKKKEEPKSDKESTQAITSKQSKKEQEKNDMLADVAGLITHTDPNKKTGPGTHTLSKEDVKIYQDYLAQTPEEQVQVVDDIKKEREEKYGPISEDDIDVTIDILKEQLGSEEFNKLKTKIKGKGDPPPNMKKGDVGAARFRNVIKHYLETGGISPITGEVVPFSDSQLDHIVSLDNGGQDSPENWMWMESRFNQFKGSKTDPEVKADLEELGYRTDNEWQLSASEKELEAFQKDEAEIFWKKQFKTKGKSTGLTENTLNNLNGDEVNSIVKSLNNSLGNTTAERESHPDFISRYPSRSVEITVDGKKIKSPISRGGNIKPVKGKPETYGLVQDPDTKKVTKNPAYKGLSDEEAYKKSLDDMGTARQGGGKLKKKDEFIQELAEKGYATKSTDSKSEDNSLQKQIDELESRADEKVKAIDKLKNDIKQNPETAKAKRKKVDNAIKQWKKDNLKPDTGRKSKEVKAWNDKKNDFELKQWSKFGEK